MGLQLVLYDDWRGNAGCLVAQEKRLDSDCAKRSGDRQARLS
jgi:hypothetical protein